MLDNGLETRATDTSALASAETPRRKNAKGSPFNQVIFPFHAWDARELLDTTTNIRGSAKRNAAFTLQHGAMLTPRQPEGCVPVVVSRCAQKRRRTENENNEKIDPCLQQLGSG